MPGLLRWGLPQSRIDHVLVRTLEREEAVGLRREKLIGLIVLPKIVRDLGRISGV
jgi:hypothetical protein